MLLYTGLFVAGVVVGAVCVFIYHGAIIKGIQAAVTDIQNRLPKA